MMHKRRVKTFAVGMLLGFFVAIQPGQSAAQPLGVTLTKVGSPIWRPADFQMFTAPAEPFPDAFFDTLDSLLPLEGPGVATYTPHAGPYATELSTNAAAAGLVNRTIFPRNAITLNPNGVYLAMMWLPDPGIVGSSRDFASGPVIPNSLFPFTTHSDIFRNGAKVENLQDGTLNIRAGDMGFVGASHRAPSQVVWHPWADDPTAGAIGNYEIRWALRDVQDHGWDIQAGFRVIPEPSTLAIACLASTGLFAARRRRELKG